MTEKRFFANRRFLAYVRLLRQLHHLIPRGQDETEQAKAFRERMDVPAGDMTPQEIACLKAISADFYTLSGSAQKPIPAPADLDDRLREELAAADRGDFVKALELVRQSERYVQPALAAAQRALIWAKAGVRDIAQDFLKRSTDLTPEEPLYSNPFSSLLNYTYDPGKP